jgi:cytochrome c oxidase assembly protein subunit 15
MAKRAVFQEVGQAEVAPARRAPARGGSIDRGREGARRAVRIFLAVLFALVVAMIAVGGLTRLTDSGLSITEWAPVTGAVPPLSAADWEGEFELYRAIPEYQLQNRGMSLEEFKVIYWWEWGHRQLGRVIGLVWAVGLAGLLLARKVPPGWTPKLVALGALGGLQGAIGWWMVSSGLEGTMLDVASYRLAVHLGLAFLILGLIAWFILDLSRSPAQLLQARRDGDRALGGLALAMLALTAVQILIGALVAGIDAGRNYIDWPLMAGGLTPPGMWELTPLWRNLFENDGTVQFFHRMWGYAVLLLAVVLWRAGARSGNAATRGAFALVLAVTAVQTLLGIVTVMTSAPWWWAILHQFTAVILVVAILRARHRALFPLPQSVRSRSVTR